MACMAVYTIIGVFIDAYIVMKMKRWVDNTSVLVFTELLGKGHSFLVFLGEIAKVQ